MVKKLKNIVLRVLIEFLCFRRFTQIFQEFMRFFLKLNWGIFFLEKNYWICFSEYFEFGKKFLKKIQRKIQ